MTWPKSQFQKFYQVIYLTSQDSVVSSIKFGKVALETGEDLAETFNKGIITTVHILIKPSNQSETEEFTLELTLIQVKLTMFLLPGKTTNS